VKTIPAALHVPELADEPGLIHGFSTTLLGSVGLTHAADKEPVLAARRTFMQVMQVEDRALTTAGAVHGKAVARIEDPRSIVNGVDAMVTDRRNVVLFTTHADCYPIVLWDLDKKAAGLVHAGWRGTQAGVATAAVECMRDEYGCEHIVAGIGPGICARCYEVGPEFESRFESRFLRQAAGDRLLLDLVAANRVQLEDAGVGAVYDIGICTKESYLFPSHRRHPDGKRFGAIVALR